MVKYSYGDILNSVYDAVNEVLKISLSTSGKTIKTISGEATTNGDNTIISAVAGKKIKIFAVTLTMESATAENVMCRFEDGAGGTELFRCHLRHPDDGMAGLTQSISLPSYLFETSVNTLLNLEINGTPDINYSVSYIEGA